MDPSKASLLSHEQETALSVDRALELAGGWSTFQRRLMFYLSGAMAASSAHMLCPIFLIPRMMQTWHLSAAASSLQSSVFFVGYCVGVVLWASVSDSRGRRPATVMAFAIGNVSGILSFFTPSYALFVLMRFVCGVGVAGAKNGCFLLATEFAPPAARARVGALISYAWLVGLLYLVGVAWALQHAHWRWLVLAYIPALVIQLLLSGLLPESPRFLLVLGETERARQGILSIFEANGRAPPEPLTLRRPHAAAGNGEAGAGRDRPGAGGSGGSNGGGGGGDIYGSTSSSGASSTFAQLWRRDLRQTSLIIGFCQGVCTMVFYAITFDPRTNAAAGDLYLGALLGALVELPAYALLEPLTNGMGRKRSYCAFLALSALCLLALHLAMVREEASEAEAEASAARISSAALHAGDGSIPHPQVAAADTPAADTPAAGGHANWHAMVFALGGRFASVAAVNVAYIVSAEIYPTSCRNSAVGWGTGCGRIGAIVAPMLMLKAPQPLLIFMALCLVATALVSLLPETAGRSLADVPLPRAPDAADRLSQDETPENSPVGTCSPAASPPMVDGITPMADEGGGLHRGFRLPAAAHSSAFA